MSVTARSLRRQRRIMSSGGSRALPHVFGMLRFLPHRVRTDPRGARLCLEAIFCFMNLEEKVIVVVFFKGLLCVFAPTGAQNFDVIRLSTYRTACKLRFVQKRCNRKCTRKLKNLSLVCWVTSRNVTDDCTPPPLPTHTHTPQFTWWMSGT